MKRNPEIGDEIVVEIKDVSFAYDSRLVLENITLDIHHRELISIVGPNGGGKTTFLKLILGLLKPTSGTIRVFGKPPEKSRFKVGYVPQYITFDTHFPATVMDVVLMGRLSTGFFGWYKKHDKKRAWESLENMGLESKVNESFASLSGGERQRVLIARALVGNPLLLLLDEPTANVDPRVQEDLLKIIKRLNERMTILMVSHDLGFVSTFVKSVLCINRRALIHPTSEITGEMIQEIYGGDLKMVRHDHRCSMKEHVNVGIPERTD